MLVEGTQKTAPAGFIGHADSGRSELVMGHFSTLTMFPMGHGRLALGIGFDHQTKEKLWREHGASGEWKNIPAKLKKRIAVALMRDTDIYDGMWVKALDLIPDWNRYKIYLWAMRDTDPLETPCSNDCNLVLIGDAAHAIMPTIGMGASLAIEDAEALASMMPARPTPRAARPSFGREPVTQSGSTWSGVRDVLQWQFHRRREAEALFRGAPDSEFGRLSCRYRRGMGR